MGSNKKGYRGPWRYKGFCRYHKRWLKLQYIMEVKESRCWGCPHFVRVK